MSDTGSTWPNEPKDDSLELDMCTNTVAENTITQESQLDNMREEVTACSPEYDGVLCWPLTPAGATASQPCYPSLLGSSVASVNRSCGVEGIWENAASINYSSCGLDSEHVQILPENELNHRRIPAVLPTQNPDTQFLFGLWQQCLIRKKQTPQPADDGIYCPITFDGLSCWNYTPAGETAKLPCPYFHTGFDPNRYAYRQCMEDGRWFRHPESGNPWSNYTTCVDLEDLRFRQLVNTLYIVGYCVSVVALCLSLAIFFSFRSLKCTRIAVHVQLFISFAANNIAWLIWYRNIVPWPEVVMDNGIWCQALHIILQYLMVANYMWMFCEGLHLHLALVVVFVKERVVMRWFHVIGWGLPILITTIYAAVRRATPGDSKRCWMEESLTQWILTAPVLISMLASTVFLVNVVRVLLTKLHSGSASPAPVGVRKAVRATLILVPLFGIHHILIPFRPEPGEPGEHVYQVFSAIVVSLQGFCVSCLFCFANVDVHCAVLPILRRSFPCMSKLRTAESAGAYAVAGQCPNTITQSRDVCGV